MWFPVVVFSCLSPLCASFPNSPDLTSLRHDAGACLRRSNVALHPRAIWGAKWAWGFALIGGVFLARVPLRRSPVGYLSLLACLLWRFLLLAEEIPIRRTAEEW